MTSRSRVWWITSGVKSAAPHAERMWRRPALSGTGAAKG